MGGLVFCALILSSFPFQYSGAPTSRCCPAKTVGEVSYLLKSEGSTSQYGCHSPCIYEAQNEPGSTYYFALGVLPVVCLDTTPTHPDWVAKELIPLSFDLARGYYKVHDYDTEEHHKLKRVDTNCVKTNPFRTITGICNNLNNKKWGSSGIGYQRLLPNAYEDKIGIPRGGFNPSTLPSPRTISTEFHKQLDRQTLHFSNLFYQFGQFVGHDSGLTPEVNLNKTTQPLAGGFNNTACAEPPYNTQEKYQGKCFNINVTGDSFYINKSLPTYPHLGFARTLPQPPPKNKTVPREQLNAGTGFHDASIVYGFNDKVAKALRTYSGGRLIVNSTENNLLPLINISGDSNNTLKGTLPVAGGDPRANMHPWLLSLQTLFLREHNRVADAFKDQCGEHLSDETIFENSRRVLIAEYQNIIYSEFLPNVIGAAAMNEYDLASCTIGNTNYPNCSPKINSTYHEDINPSIFNGFQTAAMRFGHSMVQQGNLTLQNLTENCSEPKGCKIPGGLEFRKEYFNDNYYYGDKGKGNDEVLGGMTIQHCQRFDRHVSDDLRNYLYDVKGENNYGDDLASRNIQRGRDHGLPSYMEYRKHFNLSNNSADISEENWKLLMKIYKNKSRDIDIWTGGLAETPIEGGNVGPLFQKIISQQFHHLKFGDRFFFTHKPQEGQHLPGSFTNDLQEIIKKRTMRDLICENTNVPSVRLHALEIRHEEELVLCNDKTKINSLGDICKFFIGQ